MSEREELKPCPLCGKKVSIARADDEFGERWWFVTRGPYMTTRCNCRLFLESEKFTCDWNDTQALECRRKLIEAWNTRATLGGGECEDVSVVEWGTVPVKLDFTEDKSRYAELFGTPERAARTLRQFCADCFCGDCATCGVPDWAAYSHDYDALLEWLRGDA